MLLGALVYLAWLRWWQQYPYAYLKGAAYAGFVFVGLAAAGWQALSAQIPGRARLVAAIAPLLLAIPIIVSQAQIVSRHWDAPGLYPADFPALLDLRTRIPAGSTVTLADDGRTEGVTSGLAAYALDHTTVWGRVKTGYTTAGGGAPDAIGEYALLPIGEDPTLYGYGIPIWHGGSYALYQRPQGVLAQLRPEYVLAPGQSLALAVGDQHLALSADALPTGQARRLDLVVAALHEAAFSLDDTAFAIPAGGARVQIAALPKRFGAHHPQQRHDADPAALGYAGRNRRSTASTVTPLRSALVASANASADGQSIITTLETLLPDGGPLTLALDIWDRGRALHYGWYGVEFGAGTGIQTTTFNLDVARGEAHASASDGTALPFGAQFVGLQAGDYSARLQVSAGAAALAGSGDLFSFHVGEDQTISDIQTASLPFLMTVTNRPPLRLDMRVGDDLWLQGYAIDKTSARPGDTLLLHCGGRPRPHRAMSAACWCSCSITTAQSSPRPTAHRRVAVARPANGKQAKP